MYMHVWIFLVKVFLLERKLMLVSTVLMVKKPSLALPGKILQPCSALPSTSLAGGRESL